MVKPARVGSSVGVTIAHGIDDSIKKALDIISKGIDYRVLIKYFLKGGSKFAAIVIDAGLGSDCQPIGFLPTEVELSNNNDVNQDDIFNYQRKYLPTQQVTYHIPPCFPTEVIECIRGGAALLFQCFGLRDFARIDGWFLPSHVNMLSSLDNASKFGKTKSGTVIFTDINLISGIEQTSFLFQQSSKVGFSHSNILRTVIHHASLRFSSLRPCRNA